MRCATTASFCDVCVNDCVVGIALSARHDMHAAVISYLTAARDSIGCNTHESASVGCVHCRRPKNNMQCTDKTLRGAAAAAMATARRQKMMLACGKSQTCDTNRWRLSARLEAGVVAGKHLNLAATNYQSAHGYCLTNYGNQSKQERAMRSRSA